MPLAVRRFRGRHPDDLIALFRDTVRRVNARDYTREQILAWAPDKIDAERWAERLRRKTVFVAHLDSALVGFGDLEADGRIDMLYVHAGHQRRGIGRALLQRLEAAARRRGTACLEVDASITARGFFERHGIRLTATQQVEHNGQWFINHRMRKSLA